MRNWGCKAVCNSISGVGGAAGDYEELNMIQPVKLMSVVLQNCTGQVRRAAVKLSSSKRGPGGRGGAVASTAAQHTCRPLWSLLVLGAEAGLSAALLSTLFCAWA